MSEAKTRLDRVYQASTPEQLRESYQAWASHYESDLVDQMGYDKPQRVGQVVVESLPKQAKLLDVGCGTGLVGDYLHGKGFADITGLDFCEGMLAQARQRNVYGELLAMDLGKPLSLPSDHFDGIVGVGVFTEGHASPKCLGELIRVVRPEGRIFFSLRDDVYHTMGFQDEQDALAGGNSGQARWKLCERRQIADGLEGRPWSIWVYEVL